MDRQPVTPEDLLTSGELARDALANLTEPQWQEQPPGLTWTRAITGFHICSALQFYATQLAVGASKYSETIRLDEAAIPHMSLAGLVRSQTALLASVAKSASPGARAWHPTGSPDAEGFLAMGCAEVLLHTWDAVQGSEIEFSGDEAVSGRVLERLFPWTSKDTPRWQTLLFATGRSDLEGHESPGEHWMWQNAPLDEWTGQELRSDVWVKS